MASRGAGGEEEQEYVDIRLGLERFGKVVWDAMQKIVVSLLKNASLVHYKIEPFLAVLDAVSKLIEFGDEFSGGTAATHLQACILQESRSYFHNFHKKKLEDLRTMMDNERWEPMPVHSGFAPEDIREIRHFIEHKDEAASRSTLSSLSHTSLLQRNIGEQGGVSALASLNSSGNPFSERKSTFYDQDSDEEDEELKQDFVAEEGVAEEVAQLNAQKVEPEIGTGASVTITCVNVVRYIGNYLQMMKILQPIAFEVFQGVQQLYQFYLYTVFFFFAGKPPASSALSATLMGPTSSFTMQSLLKRTGVTTEPDSSEASFIESIRCDNVRQAFGSIHQVFFMGDEGRTPLISHIPTISTELDIQSSNSMYGLKHRTVALESLEFLARSMNGVKVQILQLLPRNFSEECEAFYKRFVGIVPSVRDIIMEAIGERFVNVSGEYSAFQRILTRVFDSL